MIVNTRPETPAMQVALTIGTIETPETTETDAEMIRATGAAEDMNNAIIATTEIGAPHHASRKDALDSHSSNSAGYYH